MVYSRLVFLVFVLLVLRRTLLAYACSLSPPAIPAILHLPVSPSAPLSAMPFVCRLLVASRCVHSSPGWHALTRLPDPSTPLPGPWYPEPENRPAVNEGTSRSLAGGQGRRANNAQSASPWKDKDPGSDTVTDTDTLGLGDFQIADRSGSVAALRVGLAVYGPTYVRLSR
ncbi:hypothetical protein C8Q73DRAFT_140881 [Cubamyces lactineus]|nr:hypothetical protein C8Q73DRAFT_140881 [Cubamyces lactineus]